MTLCFDIDGVLCTNTHGAYESAKPFADVIAEVNRLFDEGHRIILHTARGSTTGIDWRKKTEDQLRGWKVSYHALCMGKPTADMYIDDRGVNAALWKERGFSFEDLRPRDNK
jgi:uncharacterized HAD superfamily protein